MTSTENWQHYDAQRPHARDERWDLSELFHNPISQPQQPFTSSHHGSFHESEAYDHNASYIPQVKSEYVEHGYDLFNSQPPQGFAGPGARAAFQESPTSSSSSKCAKSAYEHICLTNIYQAHLGPRLMSLSPDLGRSQRTVLLPLQTMQVRRSRRMLLHREQCGIPTHNRRSANS